MSDDIVRDVAELAQTVGLEVRGLDDAPSFCRMPMVYGPLDSIAILVDTFIQYMDSAPRRYRVRRVRTTK